MSYGLIIVQKELQGETWVNTHAFDTGGVPGLGDDDMIAIGMDLILTGLELYLGGTGFEAATAKLISAIIAFERYIHLAPINFKSVYVTDGKITTIGDPNTFAVAALSFQGTSTMFGGPDETIVPGNVAYQVNRVPAGFSARQGRMFLRGTLTDNAVRFAGRGGVDFTTAVFHDAANARVQSAVAASGLDRFFGAGQDGVVYGIPQYARTAITGVQREGQLIGINPVGSLVGMNPVSRQMKRGKKRAA
jgi:hypothetical protein